jgi:dTDP-4-dehydrorhamnose reductase
VCLVTGGAGQLARALAAQARSLGWTVHAPARAELDVSDGAAVQAALARWAPDWVFNAAAYTDVDGAERDPTAARRTNAQGPAALARACAGRARLLHVSTDYVFSGHACEPIPEDAPAQPCCLYGLSKWEGEQAVREAGAEYLIARTQWLFGAAPGFVRAIQAAARRGVPLRVVEDQLGRPTSCAALAVGLLRAAALELRGTLHLACEGIASRADFARQIVERGARRGLNPSVPIEPIATAAAPARPARRPAYAVLGLARAREHGLVLGHWEVALENYLDEEKRLGG